ncbi:TetR family transcriptional regulator [Actinomadura sp. 7K507]|uniref:TetR family transcriptional regulator n=1 Tax=Actinomadura sp. 7K507 TaxID=2530365 RepID=UPI00140459CA|nr:TetR family transcriptional regulator [Actinomadura sp. 7K507]
MGSPARTQTRSERAVLQVVTGLLETEGYEAVRIRDVAARAHVSTRTIYESFGNRDEMIVTALQQWMQENVKDPVNAIEPVPGEPIDDGLMRLFRQIFEPWERHPRLLMAVDIARRGPGGERLVTFGRHAFQPAIHKVLKDTDPEYARDVSEILYHVVVGLLGQFRDRDLPITSLLPVIERAVRRLTESRAARPAGSSGGHG